MGSLGGLAAGVAAANLAAALLGALLALAVALSPAGGRNRLALAGLLLVGAYILLIMVAYQTGWIADAPALIGTHSPLILLPGPLAWLFARGLAEPDRPLAWRDGLHFLPFLAYLAWLWPVYVAPVHVKLEYVLGAWYEDSPAYRRTQFAHMTGGLLHVAAYFVPAWRLLRSSRPLARGIVRTIAASLAVVWLVFAARFVLDALGISTTRGSAPAVHSAIALFLLALSFAVLRAGWAGLAPSRGRSPSAPDATLRRLGEEVLATLRRRELHRDPDLDLDGLAGAAGLTRHQVSEALNRGLGRSFADVLRAARVAAVRAAIDAGDDRSLDVISAEAGFASRTTFHQAFRQLVGESPGAYRRRRPVRSDRSVHRGRRELAG